MYTRNTDKIARKERSGHEVGWAGDDPSAYIPDDDLVNAVNTALLLNRPLLVTGDPGTGKTQLAYSVAWQLEQQQLLNVSAGHVEKFETKSTSVARDLFYSFDTLRRFQARYVRGSTNNKDYITYNALGRSLINALPKHDVEALLPSQFKHVGPVRSVVLIDEIDKAPRDFPNDMLNEIDQMYFRVPELENVQIGGPGMLAPQYSPIVFITSNSERNLPDPFLRRCIYYNIPFPKKPRLYEILLARLASFRPVDGVLVKGALDFFEHLRDNNVTKRQISPAELIQWLSYMLLCEVKPTQSLKEAKEVALAGLCTLSKQKDDQQRIRDAFVTFIAS